MRKRVRVLVSGRVQGVFFRAATRETAVRLGVSGWVRNLPDGRVEATFEGDAERVDEVVAWTKSGPERARVDTFEVTEEPSEGIAGFEVR